MELDRRQVLVAAAMALATGRARAGAGRSEAELPECHQLTRSLIERARRASAATDRVDADAIARVIRQTAEASGGLPVIKWMARPADAFDHLRKLNSSDLGTELAALWRVRRSYPPCDEDAFERSFRVRQLASDILRPDEHDRILMAPKLRSISEAKRAGASPAELRRVRAACFEMGWLETSLPAVATESICAIEALLVSGAQPGSDAVRDRLRTFEAYELGLLATWETPAELICVPRIAAAFSCLAGIDHSLTNTIRRRGRFLRSNQAGHRLQESNEAPPREVQQDFMVSQPLAAFDGAQIPDQAVLAATHSSESAILEAHHGAKMHREMIPSILDRVIRPAGVGDRESARAISPTSRFG
jgi:hypothetical protein